MRKQRIDQPKFTNRPNHTHPPARPHVLTEHAYSPRRGLLSGKKSPPTRPTAALSLKKKIPTPNPVPRRHAVSENSAKSLPRSPSPENLPRRANEIRPFNPTRPRRSLAFSTSAIRGTAGAASHVPSRPLRYWLQV
jgi:hypothetical protein